MSKTMDDTLNTKINKVEKRKMQNISFVKIRDGLPNHSFRDLNRL